MRRAAPPRNAPANLRRSPVREEELGKADGPLSQDPKDVTVYNEG
jgi:hypothetical protein